ncbi:MAG: SpoIIE family protein phosphatase [Planctomycetes bacterium]|nr:SpoIIE family protein phosphatase [Planctomycetota bacterium]
MPALKIVQGINTGQCFDLHRQECLIGREAACQIVLRTRTVSRQHARIVRETDGFYVEDMRSVNGTGLNGQRIEGRTRLQDGDHVQIYDTVLKFYEEEPSGDHQPVAGIGDTIVSNKETLDDSSRIQPIRTILVDDDLDSADDTASQKLRAILKIARSLGKSLDLDVILPAILETLFDVFPQTQRGYVMQALGAGDELVLSAIKHRRKTSDTVSPIGSTVARRVMSEGAAFLSGDELSDKRLKEIDCSVLEEEARSIICAPLIGPSRTVMGVIQLETGDPRKPFDAEDLEVLVSVALLAGQAAEFARLHESLLELDWRRREVKLAKDVQLHFLPQQPAEVEGYSFYHQYQAADQVAGDYFDYIRLPDGRIAVAQGDVSGKGISAALLMARLCSDVRFCLLSSDSVGAAVAQLNKEIIRKSTSQSFVTLLLLVLDPNKHEITSVNAGHVPPMVRRHTGEVEESPIEMSQIPLGVKSSVEYVEQTFKLDPHDIVLCYTDGVSERMNPQNELFGVDRIRELLQQTDCDPVHIGRALDAELRRFAQGRLQNDDICIVCFGRDLGGC